MMAKTIGVGLPDYGGTQGGGINRSGLPTPMPAVLQGAAAAAAVAKDARRDFPTRRGVNYIFALDAPFTRTEIEGPGTLFWISSLDADAFARLQIDNSNPDANPERLGILVRNGFYISGVLFEKLYLTNPVAQAGKTIEITIFRDYPDARIDVAL